MGADALPSSPQACKKPGGTDAQFCEAIAATHRRNEFLMEPRLAGHRHLRAAEAFVVRHFAGDVCYLGEGWIEKNNDAVHPDLLSALGGSSNMLLALMFSSSGATGGGGGGGGNPPPAGRGASVGGTPRAGGGGSKGGGNFSSVSRRFIADLAQVVRRTRSPPFPPLPRLCSLASLHAAELSRSHLSGPFRS